MAGAKYKYNPSTCRYEPYQIKGNVLRRQIGAFVLLSFSLAALGYVFVTLHFSTIDEFLLEQENSKLKIAWAAVHQKIESAQKRLLELIDKDDHNYRVILDSEPLPSSIREAGIGGSEKYDVRTLSEYPYLLNDFRLIEKIKHQSEIELQSYNELQKILDVKVQSWAARPAIQPVSNPELKKLHLTYGQREHPIFKVLREHKGLDFAADHGTPVYATGDGVVAMAYFSGSYGNVIYLDHQFDYESRYAHLSTFAVTPGEKVKRGQLIGYVGNTGYSVAPHLHYEVLYKGNHVNPINFFQRDVNYPEYQKLIELGSENTISLD
jgi:murein DD-endopeptidase MepM/ murein hydrolase activator NlpD